MFLVMSRAAVHCRGDFAVDFRSHDRSACLVHAEESAANEGTFGFPVRERIVVEIVTHHDPENQPAMRPVVRERTTHLR